MVFQGSSLIEQGHMLNPYIHLLAICNASSTQVIYSSELSPPHLRKHLSESHLHLPSISIVLPPAPPQTVLASSIIPGSSL